MKLFFDRRLSTFSPGSRWKPSCVRERPCTGIWNTLFYFASIYTEVEYFSQGFEVNRHRARHFKINKLTGLYKYLSSGFHSL